ncbi:uncharacterized protein LOC133518836 [Cydia pomonella]|uniref:uncharacterized protein LOC133518836 n=1 Tax=Cydia pomonella TaxID=82600 RepID=UPI002ADD5892|nr:uncharacterized protein LOC133518836 [Cydia pomonella]
MLKSTVKIKNNIDIRTYNNLMAFLKRRSDGFTGRKSKVLSPSDVEKFLKEAPDYQYFAAKVALIFGVTGACRRKELSDITTQDIETHGKMLLVKIKNTKNKIPRIFTIDGPFYEIVKQYQALRSPNAKSDRFFQNFQKGKCTAQPIGINKFGAMPKEIAKYLDLPDADSYTGHRFRRTSATLLADSGADVLTVKRHGGWRSDAVAESYVEDSLHNKAKIGKKITRAINLEQPAKKVCPESRPGTSRDSGPDFLSSPARALTQPSNSIENNCSSPTFTQENEINNNITETVMPNKTVQYRFETCTFTNCLNN